MPEEKIWLIFDCLASGIAVMENGNENIEGASWDREICHMDIKPDNIFIQNEDDQHPNSIFKFGDFGVSCEALPYDQQSIEWMKCQFFTPDYESPEQAEVNRGSKYSNYDDEDAFYGIDPSTGKPKTQYANTYDPALKYGSHTNVWAVGKVMYNLINRGASFDNDAPEYEFELSPGDGIVTQGQAIISAPYSATLRKTVMRCLAVDWQDRPMTRDLLDTIDRAILAIQRSRAGSAGAGPGAGPHPEPTDDDPNSNFDSSSVSHGGAGGEGGEGGGGESADQGSQFSVERVEHFVDATGKIVTDLTEDSVEGSRSSMSKATGVIDLTEE
ncbi:hypothetical protein BDZ45DRAFT_740407 [Acephala macrosclerotiorum]|nr:hypothetical protein BDZ45DRAFT_740407 [Acephala macrosclerotiorum]